ncbi:MAG: hypothetical protein ACPKM0_12295 [Pleomorphochaeta sp.]
MEELLEKICDDTFNVVLRTLEEKKHRDDFSLENIKKELESYYKYEGLDWTGRGDTKQAEIEGTIMAYQVFIDKIEKGI